MEALEVPSPIRDYSSERFIFPAMSSNTCVKQTPNGVTGCGNRNSRSHSVYMGLPHCAQIFLHLAVSLSGKPTQSGISRP